MKPKKTGAKRTLTCFECRDPQIQLVAYRQFDEVKSKTFWFYRCLKCGKEYDETGAKRTLTCFECRGAQIQLVECRQFDESKSKTFWFYRCPWCGEEYVALQVNFSPAPKVKKLLHRALDDTEIGGVVIACPCDLLAINPARDHEGKRVYWD